MNIDDYMALDYPMEIWPDEEEGGFTVSFPDLPGCLTCVESWDEIAPMAADARRIWTETCLEDGQSIPLPGSSKDYSGRFQIRLPRSLHRGLVEDARREGVSLNQLCVTALAESHGRKAVLAL